MAEFVSSVLPDPGVDPLLGIKVQQGYLAIQAAQQQLADQATFRANAPGLLARDPTATGASLGSNPQAAQAFLNSIPSMDQNTREQAASDLGASASMQGPCSTPRRSSAKPRGTPGGKR